MSHAHDAQTVSPLAAVVSPEPECGKTTVLLVAHALVQKALMIVDITPAILFRTIEKYRPTLLVDEADTIFRENDELRRVFNAGHTRQTAFVPRTEIGRAHV